MRVHNNKELIEKPCEGIYFIDGLKIGSKLLLIALNKSKTKHGCVGLAHNQIGGNKNVFVARVGKNKTWKIFINPSIIKLSGKIENEYEGCLTFPGKLKEINRYTEVIVEYQTRARSNHDGPMMKQETFVGFNAKIIQHEMDHLEGKHIFRK